ncbi:hypothetical protein K3556_07805 [Aliiroseovarius sp. M344]|uniref:hypothetical protein n=1 Tax=Aliiroseovarius sp. M344 TaxID=2867010 RepID=UPI0021ADD6D6|nr:hypothetical protein [Aliiroseovarius sp. M344]UWQ15759.1 hypothetical protein K3556_07805 [Aliiroseovarius sp. M344]
MTHRPYSRFTLTAAICALAATAPAAMADGDTQDPLFQALAGKSFVGKTGLAIKLEEDGTITGGSDAMQFGGTWSVEGGQYCRTLTEPTPEPMRSSGCLDVQIDGDQATLTSEDGTERTYTLR